MRPHRRVQRGFSPHSTGIGALKNIRIVMVGVTHPGNIGAASRVMKNMGLHDLILVSSCDCGPNTEAYSMASGAYSIVESSNRFESLEEAIYDCSMVVGTSARIGSKRSYSKTPEELIPRLLDAALNAKVAIVFGRESKGLSNEELKLCDQQMIIPTDSEFASLNVAQAIAIISAEIFRISCKPIGFQAIKRKPAQVQAKEEMYQHMENVLIRAGFLPEDNPLRMMRDIRRIFNSADMDERDVTIIRGMFRKMLNMIQIADKRIKDLEDHESSHPLE